MVEKDIPLIGGKSLRYNWDNIEKLTEELGLETLEEFGTFFSEAHKRFGLKHIRIMLWAGLQSENEQIEMKDVGHLIDEYLKSGKTIIDLVETIIIAISVSWGQPSGEAKGEPQKNPPKRSKN